MADRIGDFELVKKHALEMGEHFDSVQILATRHEPATENGTVNVCYGVGNWFSRYGLGRDWIIRCDERTRIAVKEDEDSK